MADQVREAFEKWAAHDERLRLTTRESNGHRIYADERTLAAWGAWQAAWRTGRNALVNELDEADKEDAASHAAEVEALRAFFRDVAELTMDHDCIELPGGDYAVVYPNKLGQALAKVDPNWTRAALKGDKP